MCELPWADDNFSFLIFMVVIIMGIIIVTAIRRISQVYVAKYTKQLPEQETPFGL